MNFNLGENLKWSAEQAREEYANWILVTGFRDAIESVNAFLESINKVLCMWELKGKLDADGKVRGDVWNQFVVDAPRRFHRLGLPDKIRHLNKTCPLQPGIDDEIQTINSARNCLVHRGGIVELTDCNCSEGLEVRWKALRLVVIKDGEDTVIDRPMRFEKGAEVGIKFDKTKKLVPRGQKLSFTAQEFTDLTWTLYIFGRAFAQALDANGRAAGHITDQPENAPGPE